MTEQNDVVKALQPIADAFQRLGIRYYIGGSVASSYHGAMRSTMDVDVVADISETDIVPLLNELGDRFYASDAAIRDAVRHKSCFNLMHLATSFKVDVFCPPWQKFRRVGFRADGHRTNRQRQYLLRADCVSRGHDH